MTDFKIQAKPCDMPCPKCGSFDVYMRFVTPGMRSMASLFGEALSHGDLDGNEFAEAGRFSTDINIKKECITNRCRCCGHWWFTATLDTKE